MQNKQSNIAILAFYLIFSIMENIVLIYMKFGYSRSFVSYQITNL